MAEQDDALDRAMLASLLDGYAAQPCAGCGRNFMRHAGATDERCFGCSQERRAHERTAIQAAAITDDLAGYSRRWLVGLGLSPRELTAEAAKIPAALRELLRRQPEAREMEAGSMPGRGFGLSGTAGAGKTFALVVLLRSLIEARLAREAPTLGRGALRQFASWCAWPATVNKFRVASLREGGLEEVRVAVEALETIPLLLLDDLGAERMRSGYEDDWAASQLDAVVSRRHDFIRPTLYTTNLTRAEFQARYGARIYSRLCGENPMLAVPRGPDLRVKP